MRDPGMPPRIVHVVYSLEVGGLENGVVNLINGLRDEFRHAVVCVGQSGVLQEGLPSGVDVVTVGRGSARDRWVALRLARVFRALRPTIVHSRNWPAIEAIPAARLAGVPLVIHGEHGREAADPEGRDRRRNRIRRLLAPWVDRFVAVSADLRRWLAGTVGVPEGKLVTICNGVDTHRFRPGECAAARHGLGLVEDHPVVGTVGRLDPVKDQAGLLEAFARVKGAHPEAVLLIAGDGPCRGELEARAAVLGLGPGVRFLGETKEVPAVLRSLDVFVLPSIAEGISNTVLEAMATGLPVVATRVGGNPELVEEDVTGALIPPREPAALAAAIGGYLGEPARRFAHGAAGRRRALERFDLAGMVSAYRELYLGLARGKALL